MLLGRRLIGNFGVIPPVSLDDVVTPAALEKVNDDPECPDGVWRREGGEVTEG